MKALMSGYAILLLPAANRVYAESSLRLLCAELTVFNEFALEGKLADIDTSRMGGVSYVTFTAAEPLDQRDIALLSNLSCLYALFERIEQPATGPDDASFLLRPITLMPLDRFESDLLTIQKYPGKTNELFTKLLVNMACMGLAAPESMLTTRLRLLDPLCGRGTTLNQAMMYGFDGVGAEADTKDFESYERFIKTWLRNNRLKHAAESGHLRRNKVRIGRRLDVTYAPTKDQFKAGDVHDVSFRNVDTLRVDELYSPQSFDLIVTDAPYGVTHGSHNKPATGSSTGTSRSPRDLLTAAVPGWTRVLREGGALSMSWNTHVLARQELADILRSAGLEVHEGAAFDQFRHSVDQAIVRDLIVASKPAP